MAPRELLFWYSPKVSDEEPADNAMLKDEMFDMQNDYVVFVRRYWGKAIKRRRKV